MESVFYFISTAVLIAFIGGLVFYNLIPLAFTDASLRKDIRKLRTYFTRRWRILTRHTMELGGYVHDTAMAQFISPTLFHLVTGTWTQTAGAVAGTIAMNKAAGAQTSIITIPIKLMSNAVAGKGSYLKSIEIDYELTVADLTSLTPVVNLVTRGADLAVAVVAAQAFTQSPTLALSVVVDQHKLILTLTTPIWILNTQYVLVQLTAVAPATTVIQLLGAVANFTARM